MKFSTQALLTILAISAEQSFSRPIPFSWSKMQSIRKREVPQEHSHEHILTSVRASLDLNNPQGIVDPVFGLLGNGAAKQGLGTITDVECLQQATADQAFTNAKAAGDIEGMTRALVYRTLERNTGAVGLQSNQCTSISAVNPEIAALSQHQDPASTGAAATNKAIALELAKQIASIGGNTTEAIDSGTFAPGTIGDPTAAGHTCDNQNDPNGCIFTQNLLVPDVTVEEIAAAIGGSSASSSSTTASSSSASTSSSSSDNAVVTVTVTASVCAASSSSATTTTLAAAVSTTSSSTSTSTAPVATTSVSFGTCQPPLISASNSFSDHQGIFAFEPTFTDQYAHGSALQIAIITQFNCDNLVNVCGLKSGDAGVTLCNQAKAAVGSGTKDGALADKWNAFFGASTDFVNAAGSTGASSSATSSSATTTTSVVASTTTTTSVAAAKTSSTTTTTTTTTTSSSNLDLGSCANVEIEFGGSFDGRTENAFNIVNQSSFNHGSADGIAVLTGFICQQLNSPCGAPASTLTACTAAASAAAAATKGGAQADAWNAAFGITTNFASNPVVV